MNFSRSIKESIRDALLERPYWTKAVNDEEYRTRCPYCGDSRSNPNIGKMYIHINLEDDSPIVWNCFKCGEHGLLTNDTLVMLEIDTPELLAGLSDMNRHVKRVPYKYLNNTQTLFFDYTLPEITNREKVKYIENRLGCEINDDDLVNLKIITSLKDFLHKNQIKTISVDPYFAGKLNDHYVGFLSYGASYIMFRDTTETEDISWFKYPITKESRSSRGFYSISSEVDIFTEDKLQINLSEGVLDIVSAYLNLGQKNSNTMNIAVCGKQYDSILRYLTEVGICGTNVELSIYADNDARFNKNAKNPTTIEYFEKQLKNIRHLYGKSFVYYNELEKDIGIPKEKILLKKYQL